MYEELKEDVIQRLKSLNYTVKPTDEFALQFIIDKVEQDIKNKTNQDEVPSELHFVFVERVCGEFLRSMMASKLLSDEQIDSVVTSIKEGDTNISFDVNSSPQAKFDAYTKYLANSGNDDFAKFRRFVW
nr:MAG TPA: head to tail adaptor [Caudoviricetes sp.]